MKIFSTWQKFFNLYYSEALNLAEFKYTFGFFFDQKLQSRLKMVKNGQNMRS